MRPAEPVALEDIAYPRKGRGGFLRNQHEQVVVAHPDGGKRTLIYDGASSLLDFGRPYTGDRIHGDRGTFIHDLIGVTLAGGVPNDELVAQGEALGIPEALQRHITRNFTVTREAWGITSAGHVERCYVHDGWRVASNADDIDRTADGRHVAADFKSSGDVVRTSYALQLAALAGGSVMYDPDTGTRTPWPFTIDPNVGHIWWYPIGKAIAADPADWPTWTLVRVDLRHGHAIGNQLAAIKYDPVRRGDFNVGATPAEQVAAVPTAPDEGDDIDADTVAALRQRYDAIVGPPRAAYTRIVEQAMQASVSFHLSARQTVRRFEIARGLVALAGADAIDDDTVRALLAADDLHGHVAQFPAVTVGHLVGALDARQAAIFAQRCHQLIDGAIAITHRPDGSAHIALHPAA
jgi:hypothetical protein